MQKIGCNQGFWGLKIESFTHSKMWQITVTTCIDYSGKVSAIKLFRLMCFAKIGFP